MSSASTTDPKNLCQHSEYRAGGVSCRAADARREREEAAEQTAHHKEAVREWAERFAREDSQGDVENSTEEEREAVRQKREATKEKQKMAVEKAGEWLERWGVADRAVEGLEAEIEKICAAFEPSELIDAFEAQANERQKELHGIWRAAGFASDELMDRRRGALDLEVSSTAVDLSKINATPDSLIHDGIGLQVFPPSGESLKNDNPTKAVGTEGRPAHVPYGRNLELFGAPALGNDAHQVEKKDLSEEMERLSIVKKHTETETEQAKRESVIARMSAWTPPEDFDDGSSTWPTLNQFLTQGKTLIEMDLEALGINPQSGPAPSQAPSEPSGK